MNIEKNLKYNNNTVKRFYYNGFSKKMYRNNPEYQYSSGKWTVKNNLGQYEDWGLIQTVTDLNTATRYKDKLVVLTTDNHEYQWDNYQWVDKGSVNISSITAGAFSFWKFLYRAKTTSKYEIKFKRSEEVTSLAGIFGSGSSLRGENVYITVASKFRFAYLSSNNTTTIDFTPNTEYIVNLNNDGTLTVTAGEQTYTATVTPGTSPMSGTYCYIGTGGSGSTAQSLQGEIEYFKVWENDTLKYHFLPGADLRMYDIISGMTAELTGTATLPEGATPPVTYPNTPNTNIFFKAADSFNVINPDWTYNVDANNEIVDNLANASKLYAFLKTNNMWYVKNNSNSYEAYGLLETVADLTNISKYPGKLVILSTDSHEYKCVNNEWTDLGPAIYQLKYLKFNQHGGTKGNTGLKYENVVISSGYRVQVKVQMLNDGGDNVIGEAYISGSSLSDSQDFRLFRALGGKLLYDFRSSRETMTVDWTSPIDVEMGCYYLKNLTDGTYYFDHGAQTPDFPANTCFWIAGFYDESNVYYCKVYDNNNNLLLDLVPDYQNGIYGMKNLVDNTFQGNSKIEGGYEEDMPEYYPTKANPTLTYTKNSYNEVLTGNYLNGQTVNVYDKHYDVIDNHLVIHPRQWTYVTQNTDRSKGFTKIRLSVSPIAKDWRFSDRPNVNSDNMSNEQLNSASAGWGSHLRTCYQQGSFGTGIVIPNDGNYNNHNQTWTDTALTTVGTYIGVGEDGYNVYEFEYPITVYWSGCPMTSLYTNYPYKLQIYI